MFTNENVSVEINFKEVPGWGTIEIRSPDEIKEMDKSDIGRAEKKIRNEVKEIRQDN
jgi:hypothetical protein